MARATYRRELLSWTLLAVALGGVEGGITGVIVKNAFAGAVEPVLLNFAVAAVAGAPALSHILSWVWAGASQGRDKIRLLVTVQILCCLSVFLIALAPINSMGLALVIAGAVLARFFWSGGPVEVAARTWFVSFFSGVTAFETDLPGARVHYALNPNVFGALMGQWNSAEDELNLNFRLHVIPKTGADFYLIFNQFMRTDAGVITIDRSTVLAKLVWRFVI